MIHVSRTPEFSNCGNMNSISMQMSSDQDLSCMAGGRSRQRSHSYYNAEDQKNYGLQTQTEETHLRPRSRYVLNSITDYTYGFEFVLLMWQNWMANKQYPTQKKAVKSVMIITEYIINTEWNYLLCRSFYSYETSELYPDYDMGNFNRSSPLRQRASSLLQYHVNKKEKREGDEDGGDSGVQISPKKSKSKPNKHSSSRDLYGTEIMFYNGM